MATKNHCLSDTADIINGKTLNNDEYSNLNLNHNFQSLHAYNESSEKMVKNCRRGQNNGKKLKAALLFLELK